MKMLAILGIIFSVLNSYGQDLAIENKDQNKVLYRGFENKIVLNQISDYNQSHQIEAMNCEAQKLDENTYLVKTNTKAQTAKINIISNGQIIESILFNVENLPSPSLFWGPNKAGSTSSESAEIEIKYAPEVSLKANFEIVEWACSLNKTKFEGQGNLLSEEMLRRVNSMTTGELITIDVKVKGEDGNIRKLSGSWVK